MIPENKFLLKGADDALALVDGSSGRTIDYASLRERVAQIARECLSPGEKKLIFILADNSIGSVLAYLSAISAGHACAMLNYDLRADKLRNLLDLYRPHVLILSRGVDSHGLQELLEARAIGRFELQKDELTFLTLKDPEEQIHPSVALLLSTSGSTGSPKLARLSVENLVSNASSIVKSLCIDRGERAITSLPISYSYGLSVLNTHLVTGNTVVLTGESVLRPNFWQTFNDHRCTSFAGVPFTYEILARTKMLERSFPKSLKTLTQAGGRLSPDLVAEFHSLAENNGAEFFVMYGQTEATARISCLLHQDFSDRPESVGRAISGGTLTIDPLGEKYGYKYGEVIYRGPNVMMGYASSFEDLSKEDENFGQLKTGDLGYLDRSGFLFLLGRSKRLAKLFGVRLNLDEVESFVKRLGASAATSSENKLFIFWVSGGGVDDDLIRSKVCENFLLPPLSVELREIESVPLTSSGKIDYGRLQSFE